MCPQQYMSVVSWPSVSGGSGHLALRQQTVIITLNLARCLASMACFLFRFKRVVKRRYCSDNNLSDYSYGYWRYKAKKHSVPSVWMRKIINNNGSDWTTFSRCYNLFYERYPDPLLHMRGSPARLVTRLSTIVVFLKCMILNLHVKKWRKEVLFVLR